MAILSKLIGSIIFVVSQHLLQMAEQNDRLFEKKYHFNEAYKCGEFKKLVKKKHSKCVTRLMRQKHLKATDLNELL